MKLFMKLTLQWRITILVAIVLIICSAALTAFSILNAQRTLMPLINGPISITKADDNSDDIVIRGIDDNEIENESTRFGTAKRDFDLKSIMVFLALTTVGTGLVYFVSGKALRPVKNLSKQVSEIDERDLSQRLTESLSHDEVSSLTKSFNQALERLEEAFNRQKRFSASAAHELKTPLATMKAGIQVLKIDKSTTLEEYKENAHMMEASVDRLTQVVNDLLIMASPNEETDELKEEVYLDVMFETIFDELSPVYEYRGITYNIECDAISFHGNAALLYRNFFNLIDNSYKYNREKGSITVRGSKTNKCVSIDVEDTGIGIPAEHIPFIFDAFYRVDGSRSRKIAGSGLGLSIVKSIIERHGGTISVSSENVKGTKISIQLPQ
ncbi:integral membrane sensor signal transduction histidine kinase [Alkaliphilus metalliredigens QYMF]|uniref:histidine kinase n=1 Tax=Alkaliphilus metalliredigens (strain QYMF) TaxID=293826 RepID=A6TX94_ALKMQ|nr:ATP-binding protein [Alkaliphilus metalliredigens]ABR50812.1 integral membrane sensor signal transduction histidine kinase [Alkaliphilus metalliredigens QYMF]